MLNTKNQNLDTNVPIYFLKKNHTRTEILLFSPNEKLIQTNKLQPEIQNHDSSSLETDRYSDHKQMNKKRLTNDELIFD